MILVRLLLIPFDAMVASLELILSDSVCVDCKSNFGQVSLACTESWVVLGAATVPHHFVVEPGGAAWSMSSTFVGSDYRRSAPARRVANSCLDDRVDGFECTLCSGSTVRCSQSDDPGSSSSTLAHDRQATTKAILLDTGARTVDWRTCFNVYVCA